MKTLRSIFGLLLFAGIFTTIIPGSVQAQPTITTDTVIQISTCPGSPLVIPFSVDNGNFNPGNVFYAEMSDAFGNFDNPHRQHIFQE